MSGIKNHLYNLMMERDCDLVGEIHDHELYPDSGLEHISSVLHDIANIDQKRMQDEMQPEDAWQSSAPPEDSPF